ncbi:MAG: hypothetical protein J6V06_05040 [Clostridia bacterium]|nr:hypothetical protein [Clostridia bacterium]
MKRVTSWIFLAVEAVLFCIFVAMDVMNHSAENTVKYIAIALVGIFGLKAGKNKDNVVVTVALLFTMLADIFLILVGNFVAGVCVFICVQTCYTIRFSFMSGKPLVGELLKRLLPGLILGSAATYFLGVNVGIVVAYACSFAVNFVHGFELHILKPSPRHLRFAIGLFLFACCDACVGITNLRPGFLTEQMIRNAEVMTWIFYLPSQILILSTTDALSLKRPQK